jgi:hypothetical protein
MSIPIRNDDGTQTAAQSGCCDAGMAGADGFPNSHCGSFPPGDIPTTSVWVCFGSAAFDEAMRQNLGRSFPDSAGYVFGARSMAVLAVSSVARNVSHEFAHIVSLAVNPRLANNPRWLWEAVALFENGDFVAPSTLEYMRAGRYPTLAQLDADFKSSRQVYEVGYLLGEFIVATWGSDGLVRLVRVNGDVASALYVTVTEFEARWYTFLRGKYGTP